MSASTLTPTRTPRVKTAWVVLGSVLASCLVLLAVAALVPAGQRADRSYDVSVRAPACASAHPVVTFDEGHNNAQRISGGYGPLARLLENDGYRVKTSRARFTPDVLRGTDVLVVVNADGGTNPKLFGFNLVPLRKGVRGSPAFSDEEVRVLRDWVQGGGSLLLVADHAPFGRAAAGLGAAFGVTMHGGFTEVEGQYPGQPDPSLIQFSRENGLVPDHAITSGRSSDERIGTVRTFTGQSLDGPIGSSPLLRLPSSAIEQQPLSPEAAAQGAAPPPAGAAQALAFELGRGRVVVLGEAAMITAQLDDAGRKFGMNVEGLDNRQFALNVAHWLSRVL